MSDHTGADLLATLLADDDTPTDAHTLQRRTLSFQIKKFVLLVLLEKAMTVVPTRDVMPVLKCVQLQLDPQRLRLVASDLELTLIASTRMVTVTQPGVAVFPARKLLDIVKSAEDGDVTITVDNTTAAVHIGRTRWTLLLPSGEDYPPTPAINEAQLINIERSVFRDAITAVRYAASRDPSRANLNIINIIDGKLTACDGSRIQQIRISDFPLNLRLPISAVDDLLRLLRICELDTIGVGQSDDRLIFQMGSDVFIVSRFHAQFPDMEASMLRPALENKHELSVVRGDLLDAIRRVRINADTESSAIALTIEQDTMTVSARDKFGNTAAEQIHCHFTGKPRTVVVNHKFLSDMLGTYSDVTCAFRLGDDTKTRPSPLMLRNPATGSIAVCHQMLSDWVGQ